MVQDTRTAETFRAFTRGDVDRIAAGRSAAPGYGGLGDAVRAVTRKAGIGECSPCAKRQAQLNGFMPRLWRR